MPGDAAVINSSYAPPSAASTASSNWRHSRSTKSSRSYTTGATQVGTSRVSWTRRGRAIEGNSFWSRWPRRFQEPPKPDIRWVTYVEKLMRDCSHPWL